MCVCKFFVSLLWETRFEHPFEFMSIFIAAIDGTRCRGIASPPAIHTALLSCGASLLSQQQLPGAPKKRQTQPQPQKHLKYPRAGDQGS